jgi:hypothetical protein
MGGYPNRKKRGGIDILMYPGDFELLVFTINQCYVCMYVCMYVCRYVGM